MFQWLTQTYRENPNLDKKGRFEELVRRLVVADLSYTVSKEDIQTLRKQDALVNDWWWFFRRFEQPAADRLWDKRRDAFLLQIVQIAKDYLESPSLQTSCLTGQISARVLEPVVDVLNEIFLHRTFNQTDGSPALQAYGNSSRFGSYPPSG